FLAGVVWAAVANSAGAQGAWREVVEGKDLTGGKWRWEAGAVTVLGGGVKGHGPEPTNWGHVFFVGRRAEGLELFKNFELEAVVRGEPGANSGIFFHTDMETRDGKLHLKNGYEVQLNSSESEKRKTGSLYEVVDLAVSPVDESKWFTVY